MNIKGKALLAGCIALAFSNMALAEDIKVAVVGAMSGPVAQYGDQEFTGAEQAVADINAKGGIKGNKLQIVKYDDACDPKQAVAVANKVVNDGIKYVIGHLCSSSTQPASDIYEDEGILMITPAATAPELTARGYQLILRTTGLDSDQGPTAAKYILEKVKPQRIAIVHDKQQYGEGLARAVQDGLKKGNANVVFFDGITAGEKDFSTLVARLKKENIDFIYCHPRGHVGISWHTHWHHQRHDCFPHQRRDVTNWAKLSTCQHRLHHWRAWLNGFCWLAMARKNAPSGFGFAVSGLYRSSRSPGFNRYHRIRRNLAIE